MNLVRLGSLHARIVEPARKSIDKSPLTVVFLHGFGAPGDDLVPLGQEIDVPPGTRLIFPEARLALGGELAGGRAWWPIDMGRLQVAILTGRAREFLEETPEGLEESRAAVLELLDALVKEQGADPTRIVLGGFSQGSMLSLDLALRTQIPFAGLVLLSSTIICADNWRKLMPKRSGLRVFQSHGREDPLLPYPIAEALLATMRDAGLEVDWHPFRGGHGIAPDVVTALGSFLGRLA